MVIYCLADLANFDWNQIVRTPVGCKRRNLNLEVRMNPVVQPDTPPTQIKHLAWALYALPQWWEAKHYIGESFFAIVLGQTRLAICKIIMSEDTCVWDAGKTELIGETGAVRQSLPGVDAPTCPPGPTNPSSSNIAGIDAPAPDPLALNATIPCDVRINWLKPLIHVCTAFQFYIALMNAMVEVAELGYNEASEGLPLYFVSGDFTLRFDATSLAARQEGRLKNFMVAGAIETLADLMEKIPASVQFSAFQGTVKWDGPYVGKIWFYPGGGEGPEGVEGMGTTF